MDEIKNKAEGYASRVYDEAHLDDMRLYYMLVDAYIEGVKSVYNNSY